MNTQRYVITMPIIDTEESTTWIYLLKDGGWINYDANRINDIAFSKDEALLLAKAKKITNNPFVKVRPMGFITLVEGKQ